MPEKVARLYEYCRACHGRGYWLVSYIKKDGTESKRRKRYPCPKCAGRMISRPERETASAPSEDIPF